MTTTTTKDEQWPCMSVTTTATKDSEYDHDRRPTARPMATINDHDHDQQLRPQNQLTKKVQGKKHKFFVEICNWVEGEFTFLDGWTDRRTDGTTDGPDCSYIFIRLDIKMPSRATFHIYFFTASFYSQFFESRAAKNGLRDANQFNFSSSAGRILGRRGPHLAREPPLNITET